MAEPARVTDTPFMRKALLLIKWVYWAWLALSFLFWFLLMFADVVGPMKMRSQYSVIYDCFDFLFRGNFGSFLFISPLCALVVFIIVSISRRKVSAGEFLVITTIWGMVIYVFPHLRNESMGSQRINGVTMS